MTRALPLLLAASLAGAEPLQDRFVWLFGLDPTETRDAARIESMLKDAAAHGINGVVVSAGLDGLDGKTDAELAWLERLKRTCDTLKIELIPAGFSFGYGGPFLGMDRNLAEGAPVADALFVAHGDGTATLEPDPAVDVPNGGFERRKGHVFEGFGFQDDPGKISFADTKVRHGGTTAVRLTNFASDPHGHGRVHLRVAVKPRRCYRVTIWAKSRGLAPSGCFNIATLAPGEGERSLAQRSFRLPPTAGWTRFSYTFNSRDQSEALLYAGVWEGKAGTIWLDDWTIEETGPVNLLRRAGTPVAVRGEDGTVFAEGRDFLRWEDPRLHPWSDDRPGLPLTLAPGGRITPGTRLRASWYHSQIVHADQAGVCMAEPAIYEIVERQARALAARLKPRRLLLNMDEIRFGGTCETCRGKDMAKLVGESVARVAAILRRENPALETLYVWSDMFDPHHNAHGNYYYVQGDYTGSWNHLPKDLVMAIWGDEANAESFDFFAGLGFRMLGACYYDRDTLDQVKGWMEQAGKHPEVRGLMYTTWEGKYDLLPAFGDLVGGR